jgi:hypothetical protein
VTFDSTLTAFGNNTGIVVARERRSRLRGTPKNIGSMMSARHHFQHSNIERDEAQNLKRYVLSLSQCLLCR